jgi:cyclopropane-fatty-acyl-phospholipid synthase
MSFEQGWLGLHQILATRPSDGGVKNEKIKGARAGYPFRRDYMYGLYSPAAAGPAL